MPTDAQPPFLDNEAALATFLTGFETPSLGKGEWTHAAHVAMAAVYLRRYGSNVLAPTRQAIQRFNAYAGGPATAYHESLTILWLALVDALLQETPCSTDIEAARTAVASFGADSKRHLRSYSFDVVKSDDARLRWIAPDLQTVTVRFCLPVYEGAATPSPPAPASD